MEERENAKRNGEAYKGFPPLLSVNTRFLGNDHTRLLKGSNRRDMSEAEAAKLELDNCEKEISQIKALLRSLGPAGSGSGGDAANAGEATDANVNKLTVAWIGVCSFVFGISRRLLCGLFASRAPDSLVDEQSHTLTLRFSFGALSD